MTESSQPSVFYDPEFFDAQSAGSLRSARIVLAALFKWLEPATVLDIGCGVGTWLHAAKEFGAAQVVGIDGDYVDRKRLLIEESDFVTVDLARESVSGHLRSDQPRFFDLAMSLEVGEHLPVESAHRLVDDITSLSDAILFSAAVPFQAGSNHINEQWPEFWAILFAQRGFECRDILRSGLWLNRDVEWWYAQNALVFVRSNSAAAAKLPNPGHGDNRPLSIVHPQNLLFQVLNAFRTNRAAARVEEVEDYYTIVSAYSQGARTIPELAALKRASSAAATAEDVFPFTRTKVSVPELEIEWRDKVRADALKDLEDTRDLLQIRTKELEITRELLEKSSDDLDVTRAILNKRSDEIATTRELLAQREDDLDVTRNLLNLRSDELETTRAILNDRSKQLNAANDALSKLEERRLELEAQLGAQADSLAAVYRSASWRVTAPIRSLVGRLRYRSR